ncbi:hypothetical protein [Amycolatopsis sp. Hca4]|uniref:hypothetical protein n=1 Tax=Amycolatopsis sp. Hca4 TaxID=2742131 RepID=UPI001590C853|nr:hypothetical protein [Amycolatopsis sp. Hca4]QKV74160.1 hypothetical protein HUT10_10585 [Amycolatopsis sp. Hca4]
MESDDDNRQPEVGEDTSDAISERLAGVADDLAATAAGLRRAVDEGTVPPSTMVLVVRLENVVARTRRPGQPTAPESKDQDENA